MLFLGLKFVQLAIFQKMGCKVDHNSPFYKKYKVEVFGEVPSNVFLF
jgi:hypothetical protein